MTGVVGEWPPVSSVAVEVAAEAIAVHQWQRTYLDGDMVCGCGWVGRNFDSHLAGATLTAARDRLVAQAVADERERIAAAIGALTSKATGDIHHRGIWALAISEAAKVTRAVAAQPTPDERPTS